MLTRNILLYIAQGSYTRHGELRKGISNAFSEYPGVRGFLPFLVGQLGNHIKKIHNAYGLHAHTYTKEATCTGKTRRVDPRKKFQPEPSIIHMLSSVYS